MVRDLLIHEKEGIDQVVKLGQEALPELGALLLQDEDEWIRQRAAIAMGRIGGESGLEPLAQALLNDRDPVVRLSAAEALGHTGDLRAADVLVKALEDADFGVRFNTLHALSHLKAHTAVKAVERVAQIDPLPEVRELARRIAFLLLCD